MATAFGREFEGLLSLNVKLRVIEMGTSVHSAIYYVGGTQWRLIVSRAIEGSEDSLTVKLFCWHDSVPGRHPWWSIDITAWFTLLVHDLPVHIKSDARTLNSTESWAGFRNFRKWTDVVEGKDGPGEDEITLQVEFTFRHRPISSFERSPMTDRTLVVEGQDIHVNRGFLSAHSEFFRNLFFGEFDERGVSSITLPSVNYAHLIEFLRVLYPESKKIDRKNVEFLLELAERFQCPAVTVKCTEYLLDISPRIFSPKQKLKLASRFGLSTLRLSVMATREGDKIAYREALGEAKNEEEPDLDFVKKLREFRIENIDFL